LFYIYLLKGLAIEKHEKSEKHEKLEDLLKPQITLNLPCINVLSPISDKKISTVGEGQIETIKEEDEVVEKKEQNTLSPYSREKVEKEIKKSFKITSDKSEKDESPKNLGSMICILPCLSPLLYVAQQSCFVLHFIKSEETERILSLEKMSGKMWLYSMVNKPKKSSIRKSRKDLKFGQTKLEKDKKEVNF